MGRLASDVVARMEAVCAVMGWDQAAFARAVHRNRTTVNLWLNGHRPPSADALLGLALRMGWSPRLFEEGGPWPSPALARGHSAPEERRSDLPEHRVTLALLGLMTRAVDWGRREEAIPWKVVVGWVGEAATALGVGDPVAPVADPARESPPNR